MFFFAFGFWAYGASNPLDSLEAEARRTYNTNLDSSLGFANQVISRSASVQNHGKKAWALNWKAICFIRKGQPDSVDFYLNKCVEYCLAHQVPEVLAKARLNQTINLYQKGEYEASVERGLEALRQFEEMNDSLGMAHAYYNTGLSYHRMERLEQAKTFFDQALPIYLERGGVLDRANTYNAIGTWWKAREELDSALACHRKAMAQKLEVGAWAYCGSEHSNIAAIFEQREMPDSARDHYQRSFQAHSALGDARGMGLTAGNLSLFKIKAAEWDSAVWYGKIALEYADSSGDIFLQSTSHQRLFQAYKGKGQADEALWHYQVYDSLEEVMKNVEVQENLDELHIEYETEKKEKELAEAKLVNQRKNFWLMGSLGGILLLLIVGFMIFRSEQEKKKRLLADAKLKLESERNRISMDLHDHLGAELTILTSSLDTEAFRANSPDLEQKLTGLADQTREASAQLRETIWSVRSREISLRQLELKVKEFANRLFADGQIEFASEVSVEMNLSPGQALDIFRVVQEALTNAKKYSAARRVQFRAQYEAEGLSVLVSDDGLGFAENEIEPGFGLKNMRERVSRLGGTLKLSSSSGTQISFQIPLKT